MGNFTRQMPLFEYKTRNFDRKELIHVLNVYDEVIIDAFINVCNRVFHEHTKMVMLTSEVFLHDIENCPATKSYFQWDLNSQPMDSESNALPTNILGDL